MLAMSHDKSRFLSVRNLRSIPDPRGTLTAIDDVSFDIAPG